MTEIERLQALVEALRTQRDDLLQQVDAESADRARYEAAWNDVSEKYESLLTQLGATDA